MYINSFQALTLKQQLYFNSKDFNQIYNRLAEGFNRDRVLRVNLSTELFEDKVLGGDLFSYLLE